MKRSIFRHRSPPFNGVIAMSDVYAWHTMKRVARTVAALHANGFDAMYAFTHADAVT